MNLHPAKVSHREIYGENKDIFHATFHCAARPHVASVIICKENQILCYREVWDPHTNHKKSMCILSVMNLMDRLLVDGYWVGHTNAWTIPGTEDLKPYITAKDKQKKWLFGTVGMAVIAAALARIMMFLMES